MATQEGGKTSPTVVEYITLPCLKILHGLMRGSNQQHLNKPEEKSESNQGTLTPFEGWYFSNILCDITYSLLKKVILTFLQFSTYCAKKSSLCNRFDSF